MKHYLSYPFSSNYQPTYGDPFASIGLKQIKSIKKGDSCNVFNFSLSNHWGTHVDCPRHFFDEGKTILDYSPETWGFNNPFVLDIPTKEAGIITISDMPSLNKTCDFLIIKTHFCYRRNTKEYCTHNPGLSPELGLFLRDKYPNIRAVGFDFISLSSFQHRGLGREAHRAFLDPKGVNNPIFIVEDMDLRRDLNLIKSIEITPLLIEGVDSSPVTIIGEFDD